MSALEDCLRWIRELSDVLRADVVALSPQEWNTPSNCAPWRVRDLVVHLVVAGQGFASSVRQGLAGSVEPVGNEDRLRRQAELEAADPVTLARELDAVTTEFVHLYDGLSEAQLLVTCFHRRGNRSVRWYAAHRLAEVAFHSWDLHVSLGREPQLAEPVAAFLLATLLESNAPRTYAAGLTPQRGSGERYGFAVADDAPSRWLVTIDPDGLYVERFHIERAGVGADLTITGSAADLALLVYGRRELLTLSRARAVRLDGDPTLAERFALVFPRP
jgi:uncharacterized protein (TIGR03083 family)